MKLKRVNYTLLFFIIYTLSALLTYDICKNICGSVFSAYSRMLAYHNKCPYQYILVFTITLAPLAGFSSSLFTKSKLFLRYIIIIALFPLTVVISSIPGGILWKIHDMMNGYFTTGARFFKDLLWGAGMGLQLGWWIVVQSFPYNLIMFLFGVGLIEIGARTMLKKEN